MDMTALFYKAAKVLPRPYAWIFANPKFDFSSSAPADQKPRKKKPCRKPKFSG
jgi:hypothetical protein